MKEMKEGHSIILTVYSWLEEKLKVKENVDNTKIQPLKLLVAIPMFILAFISVILIFLVEEPLKCLFAMIFCGISFKAAKKHYKKCWKSLTSSMRI